MGFSRQEYWSGLPFPPPGDLPDPGIEPQILLHCRQIFFFFLPLSHQGSPSYWSIGRPQVFSFRNGGTRLQSQAAVFQMLVNKRAAVSAVAQDGEEWTLDPLSFWGCRATILCLINCNAPKGWGYHVKHLSSNPWFANYNSFTL